MGGRRAAAFGTAAAVLALVSLALPIPLAAASGASATARPHDGQWNLSSSDGSTFQGGFQVYGKGKRIKYFNASPAPGQSCPLQSYVVSGTFPIHKAPKGSSDTWYVGQSDSAGPAGYNVTIKGGSTKYKGTMYVTFQGPKTGKADLIVDGCDLFFLVAAAKS